MRNRHAKKPVKTASERAKLNVVSVAVDKWAAVIAKKAKSEAIKSVRFSLQDFLKKHPDLKKDETIVKRRIEIIMSYKLRNKELVARHTKLAVQDTFWEIDLSAINFDKVSKMERRELAKPKEKVSKPIKNTQVISKKAEVANLLVGMLGTKNKKIDTGLAASVWEKLKAAAKKGSPCAIVQAEIEAAAGMSSGAFRKELSSILSKSEPFVRSAETSKGHYNLSASHVTAICKNLPKTLEAPAASKAKAKTPSFSDAEKVLFFDRMMEKLG